MALEENAVTDITSALSGVSSALALRAAASEVDEREDEGVLVWFGFLADLCMPNDQSAYLVISHVVVFSVPLSSLPQGGQDEPSEVGGTSCSQSHWVEANMSLSERIIAEVIELFLMDL